MRIFCLKTIFLKTLLACCLTGTVAAADVTATNVAADNALPAIPDSTIDELRAQPFAIGAPGQPLKIAVMPISISYAKRRHDSQPYYRDSDFQLSEKEVVLLQKAAADAFAKTWFGPQHWQLVSDPAQADAHLLLEFKDFWLAAPLKESIHVAKTYAEESARFTLHGRVERASNHEHLAEFRDRRRLKQTGMQPSRVDRFNAITFWRDMRRDLESMASQLSRLVPSGKNGQKS